MSEYLTASELAELKRRATDALALAIKPHLSGHLSFLHNPEGEFLAALIMNHSDNDAMNLEGEVRLRDGRCIKASLARLPSSHTALDDDPDWLEIILPDRPDTARGKPLESIVEGVRVTYSDVQLIASYEWTLEFEYVERHEGEFEGYSIRTSEKELRIG